MSMRISELETDEVDYLRFDRIKIQRKRMEHILEVIKDLTFKNKELVKQAGRLKEEVEEQRQFRMLYEEVYNERKLLIDKNLTLSNELSKYRQTALHQEMLINTLREEVEVYQGRNHQQQHYRTEPSCFYRHKSEIVGATATQEYQILAVQYRDLQEEYSRLFQQHYSRDKQNSPMMGHIYSHKKQPQWEQQPSLQKARSSKDLELEQGTFYSKLKLKYDKAKQAKKQLSQELKQLQCQLVSQQAKEQHLLQLVQLLKEQKTKICVCHVNKLEKQLSIKSTLLEQTLSHA